MADLLKTTELTKEQSEFVITICESGESLLVINNDILVFSKIESGLFSLNPHPFVLRDCINEAVVLCSPGTSKPVSMSVIIDPAVPEWITCTSASPTIS